jgi:UDPglucose 6-dehydrogenase
MYEALENADALLICTEWSIFRTPDYPKLKRLLSEAGVFDGRNLYNVQDMEAEGFTYYSIGRKQKN